MNRVFLLFILSCLIYSSSAQDVRDPDETVEVQTKDKKSSFGTVFEGSPGKAALYSFILPGAGQIYNKRYWKAPLVWAAEGTALYFLIDRMQTYNNWDGCYTSLVNGDSDVRCGTVTTISDAFRIRQSTRTNLETAWLFMGIAHVLNALEAFIDRHLINFDTSEDIGIRFSPPDDVNGFILPSYTFISITIPLNSRKR